MISKLTATVMLVTQSYNEYQSESEEFDAKYRSNIQYSYNGEALWVPPSLQKSACEGNVRTINCTHTSFHIKNISSKYGIFSF